MRQSKTVYTAVAVLILAVICPQMAIARPVQPAAERNPEAEFESLVALAEAGKHHVAARAAAEFIRANASWDRIDEARLFHARELVKAGDVTVGKETLDRMIQAAPQDAKNAPAYFYRAMALEALGDFPGAVLDYEMVVRRFAESQLAPQAALNQALLADRILDNQRRAREVYKIFLENWPQHAVAPAVINRLASLAEAAEDWQEAVDLYRKYAADYPNDLGNRTLNPQVSGAAEALWKAAELAQNRLRNNELAVELYKRYETIENARKGQGFWRAALLSQADIDAASNLFKQALEVNPNDQWNLEYGRWLMQRERQNEGKPRLHSIIRTARDWNHVVQSLQALGAEGQKEYLNANPGDYTVFRWWLEQNKDGVRREEGRAMLDQWLARNDIPWKSAIARQWLDWTGAVEDAQRLAKVAEEEGDFAQVMHAALRGADLLRSDPDAAERLLTGTLQAYSAYPDFPRAEFANRLAALATRQPLMVPVPRPEGEEAPAGGEQQMVESREARQQRERIITLFRGHNLHQDQTGARHLANLAFEINRQAAINDIEHAYRTLLPHHRVQGAEQLERLLELLPEHDIRVVDNLVFAAPFGNRNWDKQWNEMVVPRAQALLNHFKAVNPPTEQSRLAVARLMRFFDAKESVQAVEEFINLHGNNAAVPEMRRHLIHEMRRANDNPNALLVEWIAALAGNPILTRSIPPELVPAGPEGYELYAVNARKANTGRNRELTADLLLNLAEVEGRFNNTHEAMNLIRRVVAEFGNLPQAIEARRLAGRLFRSGRFNAGTTQQDAEDAFAMQMHLVLNGHETDFASVTDGTWRLACHPGYRMRSLDQYSTLYLYSTNESPGHQRTMDDFMSIIYSTFPGDGIAPVDRIESRGSPGSNTRFHLYRWGLLRAPADGVYNFWIHSPNNRLGFEINGQQYNLDHQRGHYAIRLNRGLHTFRVTYSHWHHQNDMFMDWQVPGGQRVRIGESAFSAELHPIIMSAAAMNQGAAGLVQWQAYQEKFPNDARGRIMHLETLAFADPQQASNQLQQLVRQFPAHLHYRERLADAQWRLGRYNDAIQHFAQLAQNRGDRWATQAARVYRSTYLDGKTPISFTEDYEDRLRTQGDWTRWLALERQRNGEDGQLTALMAAQDHTVSLEGQASKWQQTVARINAAINGERSRAQNARQLAAGEEATPEVKAQALAAAERSENRMKELQEELKHAQAELQKAQRRHSDFRRTVGLRGDESPTVLPRRFALENLAKGAFSDGTLHALMNQIWSIPDDREQVVPFMEHTIEHTANYGWAIDRAVDLANADGKQGRAAAILADGGLRNPRHGHNAGWLRRSCDLALQAGEVYLFARNAHVLARLHPEHEASSAYLGRLGEVFEKAGNYISAEQEYKRVIRDASDDAQKRNARLSLARLYEKLGRSVDALKVISQLADVVVPEEGRGLAVQRLAQRPVAPRPESEPAEGEEQPEVQVPVEDAAALLIAARSYLSLELTHFALDAYDRAAVQKDFGTTYKPEQSLLSDLSRASIAAAAVPAGRRAEEPDRHRALPPEVLHRANKALRLVDTQFRFYADAMTPYERVVATLLRADANMMMRNYPRAIEEIREAKRIAGDSPVQYLADLKMGELHLATDSPDQALPIFRRLSQLNLRDVTPMALFWLGTTQLREGNHEAAIEAFRTLWERHEENALVRQAVYTIARTYAEQGAFLEAIRLYEAVGAIQSLPRERVAPGDILTVKVWDADHFISTGQHSIPVKVHTTSGDAESLLLDMNKINNSLFLGTIRVVLGAPQPGSGVVEVLGNDLIYVTYEDRFRSTASGVEVTADTVGSTITTTVIQVVDDGSIAISPTVFVEREHNEEEVYFDKTPDEQAEERRLAALSTELQRGEAVVKPGNDVYIRVQDGNLSISSEPDTIEVEVFTFSPGRSVSEEQKVQDIARAMASPMPFATASTLPDNGNFHGGRGRAPAWQEQPKLDSLRVKLTETGPNTGVFHGRVKTAVGGPTAIASDVSGEREAAFVLDGRDEADRAWTGFIDRRPDKWLEIDMKELQDVERIVWSRGQGANDRYMIDYTISLRGGERPFDIELKGNDSPHDNVIVLEEPIRARWIRFTAHTYEGDAPAIAHVEVYSPDGTKVLPPEVSPFDRAHDDVLQFNVGDVMSAEFVDEVNFNPGRPVSRRSNSLGVAYVDGHIDAIYTSIGENRFQGSILYDTRDNRTRVYGRKTKRVRPNDVLQIAIIDPDKDVDDTRNEVEFEVFSSTGDYAVMKATEIDRTAGIFTGRIQMSSNREAANDAARLHVAAGGFVKMRYFDEHNRNPGHAVYRESFVFIADDEVADFPGESVQVASPQMREDALTASHWSVGVRDGDLALPGIDRVEMRAASFATGDSVRFTSLLRDLDGNFSSRVPIVIGGRPVVERPRDADPREPRRLITLDDGARTAGGPLRVPFAVAGDDIVWLSYDDVNNKATSERLFVPVVGAGTLNNLRLLGVNVAELPAEAVEQGIEVVLRDPYLRLQDRRRERDAEILREIARKKRHYKMLLEDYQLSVERISGQIDELMAKTEHLPQPVQEEEAQPEGVRPADAPLTVEEEMAIELGVEEYDLTATEELIRATALRRDRDALTAAMRALQGRLKALERYNTDEIEAEIAQFEADYREPEPEETRAARTAERPPAWYTQDDWWTKSGGLVPGTSLNIRLEDMNIQGDTATVLIAPLGGRKPGFFAFTATAVAGEQGVFAVTVPTSYSNEGNGYLPIEGARRLLISYQGSGERRFTERRQDYLSLASNADLMVTGSDFLESKESFHVGEDIYIVVRDADMDKTSERDYVWVEVESSTGDIERVPIRESQPHSGIFRGSIRTGLTSEVKQNDGMLSSEFGGSFTVRYVDELWRTASPVPPVHVVSGGFVSGTDGVVEIFARQLRRGALQRDVLFNTALASYELGNSSMEMGAVQRGRQHLLQARNRFETLIKAYPEDDVCAHATYYLGNIHFLLGDYAAAVHSLQEVVTRWPRTEFKAMALFKLGTCHIRAGHMDRAVESFVNLAYHHPDSPLVGEAMLVLGRHFSQEQRFRAAISVGEAFLRKFPDHDRSSNMYLRVAGWLILEEEYQRAIDILETAQRNLPDSPNMPAYLYWHADCIFRLGLRDQQNRAITLLQRVMYDYPESRWARYAQARFAERSR